MIVTIKELNNKSRKGLYIYIRAQGKRGSYLKYDPAVPIDVYIDYYNDTIVNRRKNPLRNRTKAWKPEKSYKPLKPKLHAERRIQRYLKKIKKRGTIDQTIKRGITDAYIYNTKAQTSELNTVKRKLLGPLVMDKEHLELLITHENFKKLKHRYEYHISFKGDGNKELARSYEHNQTPEEVLQKLNKVRERSNFVTDDYNSAFMKRIEFFKLNKPVVLASGQLKSITIRMVFRKRT